MYQHIQLPIAPGDLAAIGPFLSVVVAVLGVLAVDMAFRDDAAKDRWTFIVALAGSAVAAVTAMLLGSQEPRVILGGALIADNFTSFFDVVLACLLGVIVVLSWRSAERSHLKPPESTALVLFSFTGMFLMNRAGDLLTLFLAIELMSMPVYVLCGLSKVTRTGREAAMKYFVLGSLGAAVLVFGMALLFGGTGSIGYSQISDVLGGPGRDSPLVLAGLALILAGLAFKIAAAPFHMWTPDVYEGAPTAVTTVMAAGVKVAGFAAAIRFLSGPAALAMPYVAGLIWWLVVLSVLVGNLGALSQSNVKRLLAYSSIAHTGYLLIGFLGGSIGVAGTVYYAAVYGLSVAGAFGALQYFGDGDRELTEVDQFDGAAREHPYVCFAFTVFLLSLAGIPPTAGFAGKFFVLGAAVHEGYWGLALLAVVASLLGMYYYVRLIIAMWMKPEGKPVLADVDPIAGVVLAVLTVAVLALGCFPGWLWLLADSAIALGIV